jgi:hypothetical protein
MKVQFAGVAGAARYWFRVLRMSTTPLSKVEMPMPPTK